MGISFGSINTGLPPNIVQQLVEAERQPIKALEVKKDKAQQQLKLIDEITGKVREIFSGLRELNSTKGFQALKLETGDPNIIAGSIDPTSAATGSYQIEVMKLAHKTSALSNGFPDKDSSQVGVGYLKINMANGETREIYVDGTNNTLEGLAKLINSKGIGIKAAVIQDRSDKDTPYRLMLSGNAIGEEGQVEFPTFYFLDGDQDFYLDSERPAENGRIKVDGVEFEIASNTLTDVIPGVTLNLRQAVPGKEINVSIDEDKGVIVGKIKTFVEQVNGVLGFIQSQNALTKDTDTTKTLGGDSLLRNLETRFRSLLQNPIFGAKGDIKYLSQLGIQFTRNGMLNFEEEKFNNAVAKNLGGVQEFFVGDNLSYGLVPQMKMMIGQMLDNVTGPLIQRQRGIKTKIDQFDHQIANKERILAQRENQLKQQFARLEETMSRMKSQGAYLQAKLGGGQGGGGFNLTPG